MNGNHYNKIIPLQGTSNEEGARHSERMWPKHSEFETIARTLLIQCGWRQATAENRSEIMRSARTDSFYEQ